MNGHSRRAMDMILRLSKSTTEDLSVFICFRSLSSVKMDVLDENTGFVRIFIENRFVLNMFFDPGIILGLFSDRKLIFRDRKIDVL